MLAATLQHIRAGGLDAVDWVVIAFYGLSVLSIGVYYSRRTKNTEDYLLGGRTMRSSSIGLSLFASLMSLISYTAIPGELINKGPVMLCWMFGLPIIYFVVGMVLIPRIVALPVTSGYELLHSRLGMANRRLASGMFLAGRMLWMGLILYVASHKILAVVLNLDAQGSFYVSLALWLTTLMYVFMGGLKAIVLINVIQAFVLLTAAIATVALISIKMGGVAAWWPTEWSSTWDTQPVFSWDPRVRVTAVGSVAWLTIWWICTAGSDQIAMQRYLATRDAPAARRAFLLTLLANVLAMAVLSSLGLALLGFFKANPDFLNADGVFLQAGLTIRSDGDKLFPYFIARFLPAGITGLVVSGLLATAMSALASGINASCSSMATDFVNPLIGPARTERDALRRDRVITLLIGIAALGTSVLMGKVTGNILEITTRTNHIFSAPLFGLFVMAMFVPFATRLGAVSGAVAGCAAAILFAYWDMIVGGPPLSYQWITLAALVADLFVGITVSIMSPGKHAAPSA